MDANVEYRSEMTLNDIYHIVTENPEKKITFSYRQENSIAHGDGANRQAYLDIFNKISETFFKMDGLFFSPSEIIPQQFVDLLIMGIKARATLPYHFHPRVLLHLASTPIPYEDLYYLAKNYLPDIIKSFDEVKDDQQMKSLTEGEFETREMYLLHLLHGGQTLLPGEEEIVASLLKIPEISEKNPKQIDEYFSGIYSYKPEYLKEMFEIPKIGRETWDEMINTMNHQEIKKLLMIVGNSLDLTKKYEVSIVEESCIRILVCFSKIKIGEIYFTNGSNYLKDQLLSIDEQIISDDQNSTDIPEFLENHPPVNARVSFMNTTDPDLFLFPSINTQGRINDLLDEVDSRETPRLRFPLHYSR